MKNTFIVRLSNLNGQILDCEYDDLEHAKKAALTAWSLPVSVTILERDKFTGREVVI
jgi:hypothetical protein